LVGVVVVVAVVEDGVAVDGKEALTAYLNKLKLLNYKLP